MSGAAVPALRRALQRHGLRGALARVPHYLDEMRFDWRYGVRTAGLIRLGGREELDGTDGFYAYAPVPARGFSVALRLFRVPAEGTFVDLGCGKGRALMLAADYGFSRLVGIDRVEDFCRQARVNVAVFERRRGTGAQIDVVCEEVTAYSVRPDESVFFLYNPFPAPVLRAVLADISRSLAERPRTVRIIYAHPIHADVIDADATWRPVDTVTTEGCAFKLYESVGSGVCPPGRETATHHRRHT